jgi:hypothetical protein
MTPASVLDTPRENVEQLPTDHHIQHGSLLYYKNPSNSSAFKLLLTHEILPELWRCLFFKEYVIPTDKP